ncbi:MAG: DUF2232 domain-containing protein [bacterium]|nr:DUF2232 domain-containing protein [bacterium]
MTESNRQRLTFACAGAVAFAFPLSILIPLFVPLVAVGLAALYYLWFARSPIWLIVSIIAAGAIFWFIGDTGHLAYFCVGWLVPGMVLAMTRRHGWGLAAALVAACLVPAAVVALYHEVLAQFITAFGVQLQNTIASPQFAALYPPERYQEAVEIVNTWAKNAPYYLPGVLVSTLVFFYAFGALLGEVTLSRTGIFSYRVPSFILWKLDEWMVLVVGVAVVMVLTTEQMFEVIGWNALVVLFMIFSVFGLSFIEYHMRIRKFPIPVKIVIYLVLFLTQIIAAVILPLIALFDAKFDFRKIRAKQLG